MIRHIVLFRIRDEYKDEIPQLVKNFYGMKGRIEGMVELEAYQTHPVHLPVKARMHEVRSASVACDFEIG